MSLISKSARVLANQSGTNVLRKPLAEWCGGALG